MEEALHRIPALETAGRSSNFVERSESFTLDGAFLMKRRKCRDLHVLRHELDGRGQ